MLIVTAATYSALVVSKLLSEAIVMRRFQLMDRANLFAAAALSAPTRSDADVIGSAFSNGCALER